MPTTFFCDNDNAISIKTIAITMILTIGTIEMTITFYNDNNFLSQQ